MAAIVKWNLPWPYIFSMHIRIGSERPIFRPDIWRQDPQLHWYAIGFNTARSATMHFFANRLK